MQHFQEVRAIPNVRFSPEITWKIHLPQKVLAILRKT